MTLLALFLLLLSLQQVALASTTQPTDTDPDCGFCSKGCETFGLCKHVLSHTGIFFIVAAIVACIAGIIVSIIKCCCCKKDTGG